MPYLSADARRRSDATKVLPTQCVVLADDSAPASLARLATVAALALSAAGQPRPAAWRTLPCWPSNSRPRRALFTGLGSSSIHVRRCVSKLTWRPVSHVLTIFMTDPAVS
jgi:hypothetical protein